MPNNLKAGMPSKSSFLPTPAELRLPLPFHSFPPLRSQVSTSKRNLRQSHTYDLAEKETLETALNCRFFSRLFLSASFVYGGRVAR